MAKLDYISSVRLTVILLILIVIVSISGTIIPQNLKSEQYRSRYGNILYELIVSLQLNDVYHSYWYTVLLAVFCVNLCSCTIRRFLPLLRSLRRGSIEPTRIDKLRNYKKIQLKANTEEEVIGRIKEILKRRFYRLRHVDTAWGVYCFERGRIGGLGPIVTHASIIIIMIGAIIVGRMGFSEYRRVTVGETIDVPNSDFQLKVEDFNVELYPDLRTPKDYVTTLTVIENGRPQAESAIEVNHPMKYKGIKFYQSGYGTINTAEIELSKATSDEPEGKYLGRFKIGEGETLHVPQFQLRVRMLAFVPDFVIDSKGNVKTRSLEMRNPAILLETFEGEKLKDRSWKFLMFPDFHGSQESDYSIKFVSIDPVRYYTELQISRDPGLSIIWIGSLLMMVGLFLSFYVPHKRIWVKLNAEGSETSVEVGGWSYRDRASFDGEFNRLEHKLTGNRPLPE